MATTSEYCLRPTHRARPDRWLAMWLLSFAPGCVAEQLEPDDSSEEGSIAVESGDESSDDEDGSSDAGTTSSEAPGRSTDDDDSMSSSGEPSTSTDDEASTDSAGDEPPCIDAHFVVFVAPDRESYVDVPAGLQVARTLANGSPQPAECDLTGGHGECLIACIPSEVEVDAIQFFWPCAEATTAGVLVQASEFLIEVDVAAAEAIVGC